MATVVRETYRMGGIDIQYARRMTTAPARRKAQADDASLKPAG